MKSLTNLSILEVSLLLALMLPLQGQTATLAQSPREECVGSITFSQGFWIRAVKVEAWGGWAPPLPLPISAGEIYSPAKLSDALRVVKDIVGSELDNDPIQRSFELDQQGEVSTFLVTTCVKVVETSGCRAAFQALRKSQGRETLEIMASTTEQQEKCVDVVIRPRSLRLTLHHVGSNVLPIPRVNRPTFYKEVPRPFLALNPKFAVNHDTEFGVSQSAAISTNLLDLPGILQGKGPSNRKMKLDLDLKGRKSVNETFYTTQTGLALARRQIGGLLEEMALVSTIEVSQQPLAEGKLFTNIARFGGRLNFRPRLGVLNAVSLSGQYRRANTRFFNRDSSLSELTTENAFEGRMMVDGRLADGFARVGVWSDGAAPGKGFHSYRRLVGAIGYQRELGRGNQTVGLEMVVGGGQAWGKLPEYARFYGGNSLGNFLYDAPASPSLTAFPAGPLLRSYGQGQAGGRQGRSIRGGTSFWHGNLTLSLPIPKWSCPLIPAIQIFDDTRSEDERCQSGKAQGSLKEVIKVQANSSKNLLAEELAERAQQEKNLSPTEAAAQGEAEAEKIFKEITPAVNFIVDKANIYSVKPLFMFDAARLEVPGDANSRTRFAIGGGIQLTIVVAKFEIGYLRSVNRLNDDPRGNLVMRLVFQNLF